MHMTYRCIDVWVEQYAFKVNTRQFEVIVLRFLTDKIDTAYKFSYGAYA